MAFDAERRNRLISAAELTRYTYWLSSAVTEAMHHFIGHGCGAPQDETRYLAVMGAHITHMLRDTPEDVEAGYYNIPREYVEDCGIDSRDINSAPYQTWIRGRVHLARRYFQAGRAYLARVENLRCRMAGYSYIACFETVLDVIERDGYRLRDSYPENKGVCAGMWMGWSALTQSIYRRNPQKLRRVFSL
jgi:phytoene/squalene synthetase